MQFPKKKQQQHETDEKILYVTYVSGEQVCCVNLSVLYVMQIY